MCEDNRLLWELVIVLQMFSFKHCLCNICCTYENKVSIFSDNDSVLQQCHIRNMININSSSPSVQWHAVTSNSHITHNPIKYSPSKDPRPPVLPAHPALSWCLLRMQLSWRWKRAQRPLVALLPWKSPSQQLPQWSEQERSSQGSAFSTMESTAAELRSSTETIACWSWSERFPAAITSTSPGIRSHKVSQREEWSEEPAAAKWQNTAAENIVSCSVHLLQLKCCQIYKSNIVDCNCFSSMFTSVFSSGSSHKKQCSKVSYCL